MSLIDFQNQLNQYKGQQQSAEQAVKAGKNKVRKLVREVELCEEARLIIQTVAKQTQEELEYRVVEPVNLALAAVFNSPYTLHLTFEEKRGKTEARLFFKRRGEITHIKHSGGGARDIASFALRVALWSLQMPKSRRVLFLDEPFKFLSRGLHPKASQMVKEISHKLNVQVIMVTHSSQMLEYADKVFDVVIKNGVSQINQSWTL